MNSKHLIPFYSVIHNEMDNFFFAHHIPEEEKEEYYEHAHDTLEELLNETTSLTEELIASALNKSFLTLKKELDGIQVTANNKTFYKYKIHRIHCEMNRHSISMWFLNDKKNLIQIDGYLQNKFWKEIYIFQNSELSSLPMNQKIDLMDELLEQASKEGFLEPYLDNQDFDMIADYLIWLPVKKEKEFMSLEIVEIFNTKELPPALELKMQFSRIPGIPYRPHYNALMIYDVKQNRFITDVIIYDETYGIDYEFTKNQKVEIQHFILNRFQLKQKERVGKVVFFVSKEHHTYEKAILNETEIGLPFLDYDGYHHFFFDESFLFENEEEAINLLDTWKNKELTHLSEDNLWVHELFENWIEQTMPNTSRKNAMKEIIYQHTNISVSE